MTGVGQDTHPFVGGGTRIAKRPPRKVARDRDGYSPRLREIVEESRKQIREGDVLSHEEVWAEVEASKAAKPRGRKQKPA
jgi:hypothetical protein